MADAEAAARSVAAPPAWTMSERAARDHIDPMLKRRDLRRALAAAIQAVRHLPRSVLLHHQLGLLAERLVSDDPDRSAYYSKVALVAFERAYRMRPTEPEIAAGLARTLDRRGDVAAARRVLEPHLAVPLPDHEIVHAFVRIAGRTDEGERAVALARAALAAEEGKDDIRLLHALARLLDRLGRYEESFAFAARGNAVFAEQRRPVPGLLTKTVDQMIAATPRSAMAAAPVARDRSELPVFIVGMGRSGTTLVEQIISGHSRAHGSGERRALTQASVALGKATGMGYPTGVTKWPLEMVEAAGATYLRKLAALAPGATRIADKLPQNFLRLPIIQRMLPGARVIHCQRNPIDLCLSAFYQEDKIPVMETYDLFRAGLAYREYERLMAHWMKVLDLPILDVRYESLVAQPEVEARRIIAFLELPWEESCLDVEGNRRVVDTSNYAAVRGPIHGGAVDRWKRYRTQLQPLIDALSGARPAAAP
ncbi:MAG: sulfotransferase [Alphaproteobacteria bacterium]|nr:sulfotransferase [Alphaproteobacteria bacterium]